MKIFVKFSNKMIKLPGMVNIFYSEVNPKKYLCYRPIAIFFYWGFNVVEMLSSLLENLQLKLCMNQ